MTITSCALALSGTGRLCRGRGMGRVLSNFNREGGPWSILAREAAVVDIE